MFEIAAELDEKQVIKCTKRDQRMDWAEEHRVVDIQAVPYSESQSCDLILTTCLNERIYIHLETCVREGDHANMKSARTEK